MPAITQVTGMMVYLPGDAIDTDIIIPARFLKCLSFSGLRKGLFRDDRDQTGPEHPLNRYERSGFKILLVEDGFGSGSSREHAPAALKDYGIDAVIAKSFGTDIFHGNAVLTEIACVTVDAETFEKLKVHCLKEPDDKTAPRVKVDLARQKIFVDIDESRLRTLEFSMPESLRQKLLLGMTSFNAVDEMLKSADEIDAFNAKQPAPLLMAA